jgi:signal transduction histidine kinase
MLIAGIIAGMVMVGLSVTTHWLLQERAESALEGIVLTTVHTIELELRDGSDIRTTADLEPFLEGLDPGIVSLQVLDASGQSVATAGDSAAAGWFRREWIFVGPRGRPRGGGPGRGNRGRFEVELGLAPGYPKMPWAARLLVPLSILVAIGLVGAMWWIERLSRRQRKQAEELARRERLALIGEAGAGLAHQLRTPLATLKGSCQLIEERVNDSSVRSRLHAAIAESERMERLLNSLLDMARPPVPQPDMVRIVDAAAIAIRDRVLWGGEDDRAAWCDADHLAQILDALVDNALAASTDEVLIHSTNEGTRTIVSVSDRGPRSR